MTQLSTLRGALFAEQLAVDLSRRGVDTAGDVTGTSPANVAARRLATDAAMTAATGDLPIGPADLLRARQVATNRTLPTPASRVPIVKLDQQLGTAVSQTVTEILRLAVASGDTNTARATSVVTALRAAQGANNALVIQYNGYTSALPIEAALQRSYLARAAQTFTAAAAEVGDVIAPHSKVSGRRLLVWARNFDREVTNALEGLFLPSNARVSRQTVASVIDGASRSVAIGALTPAATAAMEANTAAHRYGRRLAMHAVRCWPRSCPWWCRLWWPCGLPGPSSFRCVG